MTMSDFKPSPYQQAVYDFIQNQKNNLVINAVAGSGKTTTILEALKLLPPNSRTIFLAFNKSVQQELNKKVPEGVQVMTFHGLGLSILKQHYGKTTDVEPNKVNQLIKRLSSSWRKQFRTKEEFREYNYRIKKLADLGRLELVQNDEEFYKLAEKHNVLALDGEVQRAQYIIEVAHQDVAKFDFADMIYHPAWNDELNLPQYDYVFVDEAQDLGKAQQEMLKKIISPIKGRFVAVGDPKQAIYGFAGADTESFKRLTKFKNTTVLPLSVCYRCGRKIINKAKEIVPQIEHHPPNGDGDVRNGSVDELRSGDWVLCRLYRPLAKLCIELIKKKKKATIKGLDFSKSLIRAIEKTGEDTPKEIMEVLKNDYRTAKLKLENQGVVGDDLEYHPGLMALREKNGVINILAKGCSSAKEVIAKIKSIFTNQTEGIVLSTIHKAKGLENDRIFIIRPDLLPFPYAKLDWQLKQERNLKYVAYTRAKKELIFDQQWTDKKSKDEQLLQDKELY